MFTRSILPLCFLALCACSHEAPPAASPAKSAAVFPAALKLDAAPPAAQSVFEIRKTAADGADVVVTGRVRDFVDTRAVFTIADLSLKSCADEGDTMECSTPWDYCCEEPTRRSQGSTAIEVHEGGKLAVGSAEGWNGLGHLKQVTVRGKFTKDASGNVAVIASGIYVQP